ncbi:MAG: pyruvate kinase, partial [Pseudomonadota bacterium]|nr:pyruvate kinase [Pseudomonadota bacterium]
MSPSALPRATKIVATIGTDSGTPEALRALLEAGVNVFRLNFSHGTQGEQAERIRAIRALEEEAGQPVCILADLQGPKHRVGPVEDGVVLAAGDSFVFDRSSDIGNSSRVGLPHPEIFAALQPGARLLIDDGKLVLRVKSIGADSFTTTVEVGGPLSSRKGVNLPDLVLDSPPLTEKDRSDLAFALDCGVDWVALSFVQRAHDVIEAKAAIAGRAALMSKIEKPAALAELSDIVTASDGVMVARGDLGVELPPEDVPGWQKRIVAECRMVGKPVVVATQMLESMITNPTPTRAEASDVAGAVFDGADAVMLSGETAVGKYPVETVQMMGRIIAAAEGHIMAHPENAPPKLPTEPSLYHAVALATVSLAETVGAEVIVAFSTSGNTAVRIARERPRIPFVVLSPFVEVR